MMDRMKMKNINRPALLILVFVLLLALAAPATALESQHTKWPTFSERASDNYLAQFGFVHFAGQGAYYFNCGNLPIVIRITVPAELDASSLTPETFTTARNDDGIYVDSGRSFEDAYARARIEPVTPGPADYTQVQYWRLYDAIDGRCFLAPVVLVEDAAGQTATIDKLEAYEARAEKLLALMQEYDRAFDTLAAAQNAAAVKTGAYQPSDVNLICRVANTIQRTFDFTIGWTDNHDFWVEGEGWETATVESMVAHWTTYAPNEDPAMIACKPGDKLTPGQVEYLDLLLDVAGPYWLSYIEENRISEPDIASFSIGSSRGVVDTATKTVTIRMPADTDWNSVQPVIKPAGQAKINTFAGSLASGLCLYSVTPGDYATGTFYNGNDATGYGYGVDLSAIWQVQVETGAPYNYAVSFAVKTGDGKTRYAAISEGEGGADGAITLNLPVGTDLSALTPIVDYAGEGYRFTVDGQLTGGLTDIDFTKPVTLTVYNTEFDLTTSYNVTITADPSAENDIISYRIGSAEGTVSGNRVAITIPYATDLSQVTPAIVVSEFATVTNSPAALTVGDNIYVLAAENGETKTYTVTITRTPVSTARNILSFKYGGYAGTINNSAGTVSLTLPRGTSTTFAPTIQVSEFASVSPASGVEQDFSSPVSYKVTAQNGNTKTYTVTVTLSGEAAPNPYKDPMQALVNKIIDRYKTQANDDWEWMNLGLFQKTPANDNAGQGHPFDLAQQIAELDVTTGVAMTNIDRTIMMLTARGFDCSNLSQYHGGVPYLDSKGNAVDNLAAVLYNYGGGYTINGPVFALIALDMGNYTIPSNAVWTRAKLLDKLLAHEYLSDGFGLDMVAMLIYAIAPYQDDPVYEERVCAKLDEGLAIILAGMEEDYTFGAWAAINSETAAQVICALSAMGIDCHADPRFSDGTRSILSRWLELFVNFDDGYFHHTVSVTDNMMATYQGCYASQWYLAFLAGGGQSKPCHFYYHLFDFSTPLSAEANILNFTLEGKAGMITEGGVNTIQVILADGTPLTKMTPALTLSPGAALQAPNLPVTFVAGVAQPFTVLAEDGVTAKTYQVTVTLSGEIQSSGAELDIASIELQNSNQMPLTILDKTVTQTYQGADILLSVNTGVNAAALRIIAAISHQATASPALDGKAVLDLSDWKTFTITSEDGANTRVYRIKAVPRLQASIAAFSLTIGGRDYQGAIDNSANTITISGVDDSGLTATSFAPEITLGPGTLVCEPLSGLAQDFSKTVSYTVSGNDAAARTYQVSVLNQSGKAISAGAGSGETQAGAKIIGFKVLGISAGIDHDAGIITVTLPYEADITRVAPVISLTAGSTVSPLSGQVVNLADAGLVYTVTNGAETRHYVLNVTRQRGISTQLWDKVTEHSNVQDHQVSYDRPLPR